MRQKQSQAKSGGRAARRSRSAGRADSGKRLRRLITVACALLAATIVALGGYAVGWYANRARVRDAGARYRAMYAAGLAATARPAATAAPTAAPTAEPAMPVASDEPVPTPGADTLVYALPTPPPVQPAFGELLLHNPDTVGYLDIDGFLSLPVVQRENDNDHYLNHSFDGAEAREGALFLDGVNRLVPEDDCLIVYGHNMKDGTMFGRLSRYAERDFMRSHGVVRFDTIYENRAYVAFAAFAASTDPASDRYFDVRQFALDETAFELYALRLQSRSARRVDVDVRCGDRLLLLVTCDYANDAGRFIVALRQLRADESEDAMQALVARAE